MMEIERRTFLGVVAGFLGLRTSAAPERPMRSKPYIEEGRPEYEEPPRPKVYPLPSEAVQVKPLPDGRCLVSDGYTIDENGGRWRWWRRTAKWEVVLGN
jgi:hypothetical protein